jgi:hypothetical protein
VQARTPRVRPAAELREDRRPQATEEEVVATTARTPQEVFQPTPKDTRAEDGIDTFVFREG